MRSEKNLKQLKNFFKNVLSLENGLYFIIKIVEIIHTITGEIGRNKGGASARKKRINVFVGLSPTKAKTNEKITCF